MKNRVLAIVLAACMMTGLTACAGSGGGAGGAASTGVSSTGTASAEASIPEDFMQQVFDIVTADASSYSEQKAMDTYTEYSETLEGNTITFKAESDYLNVDSAFTLEDGFIVNTSPVDDYMSSVYFSYVMQAVGDIYGMDRDLLLGYWRAVSFEAVESDNILMTEDGGNTTMKLYAGGAYDFSVLDDVVLNDAAMEGMELLGEDSINYFTGIGKVNLFSLGDKNSCDITMAEHGGLTELTHKSLVTAVEKLQPAGYEDFLANYQEIGEAEGDGWKAVKIPKGEVPEFFQELDEHEEFLQVHFGE